MQIRELVAAREEVLAFVSGNVRVQRDLVAAYAKEAIELAAV